MAESDISRDKSTEICCAAEILRAELRSNLFRDGENAAEIQANSSVKSWLDRHDYMAKLSHKVSIFKVPQFIKICKPEAYLPVAVSLGPYHHKMNPEVSAMEEHKLEAVHRTFSRLNGVTLDQLVEHIKKLERKIIDCYEESEIKCNGPILPWIFLADACFILEYIRSFVNIPTNEISSISFAFQSCVTHNEMESAIRNDILKLENQIPVFALIALLRLEFNSDAEQMLATMLNGFLMYRGFPFALKSWNREMESKLKDRINRGDACHLLDLYRGAIMDLLSHGLPYPPRRTKGICWQIDVLDERWSTPKAELLQASGIQFEPGKFEFKKRLFGGSKLAIPPIRVDHDTETVLRNLMAFEEFRMRSLMSKEETKENAEDTVISQYMHLMDDLIDGEKDVALLKKHGVILSALGSDSELADMFNGICKGITEREFKQLDFVIRKAKKHYKSRFKVWTSQFRKENCSKPWYVVPMVMAVMILVMTAIQTVYAMKK